MPHTLSLDSSCVVNALSTACPLRARSSCIFHLEPIPSSSLDRDPDARVSGSSEYNGCKLGRVRRKQSTERRGQAQGHTDRPWDHPPHAGAEQSWLGSPRLDLARERLGGRGPVDGRHPLDLVADPRLVAERVGLGLDAQVVALAERARDGALVRRVVVLLEDLHLVGGLAKQVGATSLKPETQICDV